jgi:hypothetical protein
VRFLDFVGSRASSDPENFVIIPFGHTIEIVAIPGPGQKSPARSP